MIKLNYSYFSHLANFLGDIAVRHPPVRVTSETYSREVFTDATVVLVGAQNIMGRTLGIVHENRVAACARITQVAKRVVQANIENSVVIIQQASPLVPAEIKTDFRQAPSSWVEFRVTSQHLDTDVPDEPLCGDEIVGSIYNPTKPRLCVSQAGRPCTQDAYAVGDLSGKFGFVQGLRSRQALTDHTLSLFGPSSIVFRTLVITRLSDLSSLCATLQPILLAGEEKFLPQTAVFTTPNRPSYYRGEVKLYTPWVDSIGEAIIVTSAVQNVLEGDPFFASLFFGGFPHSENYLRCDSWPSDRSISPFLQSPLCEPTSIFGALACQGLNSTAVSQEFKVNVLEIVLEIVNSTGSIQSPMYFSVENEKDFNGEVINNIELHDSETMVSTRIAFRARIGRGSSRLLPGVRLIFSTGVKATLFRAVPTSPRFRHLLFVPLVELAQANIVVSNSLVDISILDASVIIAPTNQSQNPLCALLEYNTTLRSCSMLCSGSCTGIEASDCTTGCRGLEFAGRCLDLCSALSNSSYQDNRLCRPCHFECAPGGCSGPTATDCLHGCRNAFDPISRTCLRECPKGTIQDSETNFCITDDRSGRVARAVFSMDGLSGVVEFWQPTSSSDTQISQRGLNTLSSFVWEIRELAVDWLRYGSSACEDALLGPIFNPDDAEQGCTPSNPFSCPVGQLSRRHQLMPLEGSKVIDVATPLFGQDLIFSRTLLIRNYDGNERYCSLIEMPLHHQNNVVTAIFRHVLAGTVLIKQATTMFGHPIESVVSVSLQRTTSRDTTKQVTTHSWMVNAKEIPYLQNICYNSVEIFDPFSNGLDTRCGPSTTPSSVRGFQQNCRVGDLSSKLGFLSINATSQLRIQRVDSHLPLIGNGSIVNRQLAILSEQDTSLQDTMTCARLQVVVPRRLTSSISQAGFTGIIKFTEHGQAGAVLITLEIYGPTNIFSDFGVLELPSKRACDHAKPLEWYSPLIQDSSSSISEVCSHNLSCKRFHYCYEELRVDYQRACRHHLNYCILIHYFFVLLDESSNHELL